MKTGLPFITDKSSTIAPHIHASKSEQIINGFVTSPCSLDVFSYAEDDMVENPFLAKHLAHFGINIAALEKVGL